MNNAELVRDGAAAPQEPLVIGIGASAGGLEALQQFFGYMPPQQRAELCGGAAPLPGL